MAVALWPLIFAGMAGYFIAFWPGDRPLHRLIHSVCLPATVAVSLISARFLYLSSRPISVLESGGTFSGITRWPSTVWAIGPGLHICLFGVALLLIFIARLFYGRASLPLSFGSREPAAAEDPSLERVQFLIWVLLGPLVLVSRVVDVFGFVLPSMYFPAVLSLSSAPWFGPTFSLLELAAGLAIVLWAGGPELREVAQSYIRRPVPKEVLIAASFAIGISTLICVAMYVFDRMQWAAYDFGKYGPPELASYFSVPDPWQLLLFFSAFFEEFVFRGFLQQHFVKRYGLYRGIFLVGIVWAAFHFPSDRYSGTSDLQILLRVVFRIVVCVVLGFVFGWLTLRAKSVVPAAVAHLLYNWLLDLGPDFPGKDVVRIALWAVLAYVLFRYWPIPEKSELQAELPAPEAIPESLLPQQP